MSQSCGLELADGAAPGNKSFKLREYLNQARRLGVTRLLSFGGAWSNHLHALAAVGHESGFETVAMLRGDAAAEQTGALADAQPLGMRVIIVSPSEYRRRNEFAYQQELIQRFEPCLLIPEGGASVPGAMGCAPIADLIRQNSPAACRVLLPVGTGTTLVAVVAGLGEEFEVVGIPALKGARDLQQWVSQLLTALPPAGTALLPEGRAPPPQARLGVPGSSAESRKTLIISVAAPRKRWAYCWPAVRNQAENKGKQGREQRIGGEMDYIWRGRAPATVVRQMSTWGMMRFMLHTRDE